MKKTGRLLALSAAAVCSLGVMTSCNKTGFKVGLLCLHGQTSTYDKNFIDAFEKACKHLSEEFGKEVDYEIRTSVAEDYNQIKSAAKEWAEDGYSMIFADSFGHQEGMRDMALKYPNTEFVHATGTFTTTLAENVKNFHTGFADIYKGRYLAGVVAGYKLAEKHTNIDDNITIGYVGAFPYAEVISGYTSFYLGVRKGFAMALGKNIAKQPLSASVAPNLKMKVSYTGSWYDYKGEKEAAETLISRYGCELISQHADSMGAPQACAAYKVPNVCYNVSTNHLTPETYLVASKINWQPYFELAIKAARDNYYKTDDYDPIPLDYVGNHEIQLDGETDPMMPEGASVKLLEYGKNVSEDAKQAVEDVRDAIVNQDIFVFDTQTFTVSKANNPLPFKFGNITCVDGKDTKATVEQYKADVIDVGDYAADTEVIKTSGGGTKYFNESGYTGATTPAYRSAPYFDLIIDGIEPLN